VQYHVLIKASVGGVLREVSTIVCRNVLLTNKILSPLSKRFGVYTARERV